MSKKFLFMKFYRYPCQMIPFIVEFSFLHDSASDSSVQAMLIRWRSVTTYISPINFCLPKRNTLLFFMIHQPFLSIYSIKISIHKFFITPTIIFLLNYLHIIYIYYIIALFYNKKYYWRMNMNTVCL